MRHWEPCPEYVANGLAAIRNVGIQLVAGLCLTAILVLSTSLADAGLWQGEHGAPATTTRETPPKADSKLLCQNHDRSPRIRDVSTSRPT